MKNGRVIKSKLFVLTTRLINDVVTFLFKEPYTSYVFSMFFFRVAQHRHENTGEEREEKQAHAAVDCLFLYELGFIYLFINWVIVS